MNKPTRPTKTIRLTTHTIGTLTHDQLARVAGGAPSHRTPSQCPTYCFTL